MWLCWDISWPMGVRNVIRKRTVLLGLSGGVDSAVAALLLKKEGYSVVGAFIKSFSETKSPITGRCSWREDYREAQKIAAILDIPLILFDFEREYTSQVIRPMLKAYQKGITPNPDIACNTLIKFPLLWKAAKKVNAEYIATGHYACIQKKQRGYELHRGRDKNKDQSYFLAELTQKDLAHALFPLGPLTKRQVRKIAERKKFPNFDRQSSRGVCFMGNIPLKSFLKAQLGKKQGLVYNENRTIIGTHQGAHYYTIGERARPAIGIDIKKGTKSQKRFFIAEKNMQKNELIIVPGGHPLLQRSSFILKKIRWVNKKDRKNRLKVSARIRHLGELYPTLLKLKGNHGVFVTRKLMGVAPGQSAVFYQGTRVVCSGEIMPESILDKKVAA